MFQFIYPEDEIIRPAAKPSLEKVEEEIDESEYVMLDEEEAIKQPIIDRQKSLEKLIEDQYDNIDSSEI
jgi:hypothetical protein